MKALFQLKQRLTSIPVQIFLLDAVREYRPVIEDMNTQQLERGIRSDGTQIEPKYRNPIYARMKNARNSKPGFGVPDLKNTGNFHERITAHVSAEGIEIESHDIKTDALQRKYGGDIIGLTDENINELREGYIKPFLLFEVLSYIRR